MESNSNTSNTKTVNSHADVPDINTYITPLTKENIHSLQVHIESVLKTFKNKIEENSSLILAKEEEIDTKNSEFSNIKRSSDTQSSLNTKYNFILDCINFLHRTTETIDSTHEPQPCEIQKIDITLFKNILNSINDKGTAVFLMDYHYLISVSDAIREAIPELNLNLLVKLYIVEKLPIVGLLYIQKFEKSTCNFDTLKLLSYEIYEDNTITKPVSYLVKDLKSSLAYMSEMYQYQGYLSIVHPGLVTKINIKENFWSDNIDFTLTVVDSDDQELTQRKSCVAIIVTKAYANDFIYLAKEGNMQLCKQVKASRLLLIRPNAFNFDSVQDIKNKISHYILLFKFRDCVDESIPIMLFSDSRNEMYEVYRGQGFSIRDVVENEKKETFRQLIFHDAPNEVQSEIKLILTSKAKAKNDKEKYVTLPTIDRYREKNFVSCLDKNFICSFYIKSLLCGSFFINTENFPKENLELMVLGAGIGSVNYYFDMLLKNKVNITSVEIEKSMPEVGQTYFGFDNKKSNYNWIYGDAKNHLLKAQENKFDMIISDINNTNPNDGISPPPVFFEDQVLQSIKVKLK
jgi:hypothetical protein